MHEKLQVLRDKIQLVLDAMRKAPDPLGTINALVDSIEQGGIDTEYVTWFNRA